MVRQEALEYVRVLFYELLDDFYDKELLSDDVLECRELDNLLQEELELKKKLFDRLLIILEEN